MVDQTAIQFCEVLFAILIEILIGTILLQLACVLFDLFAGVSAKKAAAAAAWLPTHAPKCDSDWAVYERVATLPGVPRPSFSRALLIVFIATLINAPGIFILFHFLLRLGLVNLVNHRDFLAVAGLALPLGILVLAGLLTVMLPTRFGKGLVVALLSHLLAAILATVIVLILLACGVPDFIHLGP